MSANARNQDGSARQGQAPPSAAGLAAYSQRQLEIQLAHGGPHHAAIQQVGHNLRFLSSTLITLPCRSSEARPMDWAMSSLRAMILPEWRPKPPSKAFTQLNCSSLAICAADRERTLPPMTVVTKEPRLTITEQPRLTAVSLEGRRTVIRQEVRYFHSHAKKRSANLASHF